MRYITDYTVGRSTSTLRPPDLRQHLANTFLQDDIALARNVTLTVGTKLERNSFTGFELQPASQILWQISPTRALWFSAARAARTPSRFEAGVDADVYAIPPVRGIPGLIHVTTAADFGSEHLTAFETGYRVQPHRKVSLDLSTFYNQYTDVRSATAGEPVLQTTPVLFFRVPIHFQTTSQAHGVGAEASVRYLVNDRWRLTGGYSWLNLKGTRENGRGFDLPTTSIGLEPKHKFQLQSLLDLPHATEFDIGVYGSTAVPTVGVPTYSRVDVRFGWQAARHLDLSFNDRHIEFFHELNGAGMPQGRRVFTRLTWKF